MFKFLKKTAAKRGRGLQTRVLDYRKSCHCKDLRYTKWRRRELNPQAHSSNELPVNALEKAPPPPTAFWECARGSDWLRVSSPDCAEYLLAAWPHLPPHIKESIFTLVDAVLSPQQGA